MVSSPFLIRARKERVEMEGNSRTLQRDSVCNTNVLAHGFGLMVFNHLKEV